MRRSILLGLAVFCAASVCGAQSWRGRFDEGQRALERGDANQAFDAFSDLFREYPEAPEISFALGLAAYAKGKYSHAAFAFERVLMHNPANDRARLELARTYYAMDQFERARREFEKVLAHNPPPKVRKNVERYLLRIREQTRHWDVWGRLDFGVFHDDNVNYGPNAEVVATILGPLQVNSNSLPLASAGCSVSLSLLAYYDVGMKQRWSLVGGADCYRNWIEEDPLYETLYAKLYGGFQHVGGRSRLQLPLKFEYLEFAHETLVQSYGVAPAYLAAPSPAWHWITSSSLEYRDYVEADARDAFCAALGETVRFHFTPRRHNVALGLTGFYEAADEQAYANSGWETSLAAEFLLPWQTTVYSLARYRRTCYEGRAALDMRETARRDTQWQVTAGLSKNLSRACGLDAKCHVVQNRSTFDLYDYDRVIATLGVYVTF